MEPVHFRFRGGHDVRAGSQHLCHDQPDQASLFRKPAEGGHTCSAGKGNRDEEYAANVKALNLVVATWISEMVRENPVCKLTPIFKITISIWMRSRPRRVDTKESTAAKPPTSRFTFGSDAPVTMTNKAAAPTPAAAKPFNFGFGSTSSTTGTILSFPNVAKPTADNKPDEKATANNDVDEPTKVEFTPVKEKDSIFPKRRTVASERCTSKRWALVRADTSIGQILLKIILKQAVPVQGMGKNNVMMVCIPEMKPPPTSVLLRVKTGEEADELYETLIKQNN
ncbi:nucleoporin [Culex quinquefasciatus]|uniref:Nucleoporin n=1 Tax=Culex quinquefasciatus TaxID=7176 RepID=B0XJF3_CULQU|nr:nucleoporin [Culex quinquefasciatus]|eukprot:XP_001869775.1 nucleoporin [Culex quinquefasciatus]